MKYKQNYNYFIKYYYIINDENFIKIYNIKTTIYLRAFCFLKIEKKKNK